MKFTEEQYHEIIKAWESQSFSLKRMQAVLEIMSINDDMPSNIKEGLALANPASREWAYEQFVEKEKKYLWTTPLVAGIKYALIKENGKYVLSDMYLTGKGTPLTELEVVNIGLKTDWFNKEEAE